MSKIAHQLNSQALMDHLSDLLYDYLPVKFAPQKCSREFKRHLKYVNEENEKYGPLTLASTDTHGRTVVFYLAKDAIVSAVQTAHYLKANLLHRDNLGRTVLHAACQAHSILHRADTCPQEMVNVLLAHIPINTPDDNGRTPLFELSAALSRNPARWKGTEQEVEQFMSHLLHSGADIHHHDAKGRHFLHNLSKFTPSLQEIFHPYEADIQHQRLEKIVKSASSLKISAATRKM